MRGRIVVWMLVLLGVFMSLVYGEEDADAVPAAPAVLQKATLAAG